MRAANRRHRRGSTAVELALALPVLLALLTGVVDYGAWFRQRGAILDAARDGVRIGVAAPEGQDPRTLATAQATALLEQAGLDPAASTLSAEIVEVDGTWGLALTVSAPFAPLTGLVPTPTQLDATATMLLEHQETGYYGS